MPDVKINKENVAENFGNIEAKCLKYSSEYLEPIHLIKLMHVFTNECLSHAHKLKGPMDVMRKIANIPDLIGAKDDHLESVVDVIKISALMTASEIKDACGQGVELVDDLWKPFVDLAMTELMIDGTLECPEGLTLERLNEIRERELEAVAKIPEAIDAIGFTLPE